ncbi:hypothetical protein [Metabacillus litoralis]|uniref:hypothetical protein n=1 Tax=Metabacillus litoralis TaxID=152268 RepID=UPI002041AFE8|nr:hypothetical protein [Metabacillus litoralis]MCM3409584.1 hypothetical protein [Metabacillus litoralis]
MKNTIEQLLEEGHGVLRLAPTWVPRSFCRPGKRMKLHPDDLYVLGLSRGGINERWFASTTNAVNGPNTPEDEGLSYVVSADGKDRVLLRDVVSELKERAIGEEIWSKYKEWPVYSKLFDNLGPLPHHIHHNDEAAARVGQKGKPEMYFYPAQLNNHGGEFPYTFFGINPGVEKDQIKEALMNFTKGDNQITDLSRSYKLTLDTGWDVPPGILHAPGSLCTYEPQFASDVYAMFQSVLHGEHAVPEELLWKDTPEEEVGNYDYLMSIIDWEKNTDPDFYNNYFMAPKPIRPIEEMQAEGYVEEWICYKSDVVSAKRLTVLPGQTVTITDSTAYGFYMLQGHGKFGVWDIETPSMIRYGQLTNDEFFVTEPAAKEGVTITNNSKTEPIVLLKHFAVSET